MAIHLALKKIGGLNKKIDFLLKILSDTKTFDRPPKILTVVNTELDLGNWTGCHKAINAFKSLWKWQKKMFP